MSAIQSASKDALMRSADKWGDEGRQCVEAARNAIRMGAHGSAGNHMNVAKIAFANELELRKLLDGKSTSP